MRGVLAAGLALALAGCTTLMPGTTGAARLGPDRPLDASHDDVAALIVVFDVPVALVARHDVSVASFDFSAAGGQVVTVPLRRVDPGDAVDRLPPPAEGRTYFLLGFAPEDQARLRAAQQAARPGISVPVVVAPRFCGEGLDPARTRFSVRLALPGGQAITPLHVDAPLAAALAQSGEAGLPVCA